MVDNVQWLMQEASARERIILWCHNIHISKAIQDLDIPGRPAFPGMLPVGKMLSDKLGTQMVSIGFTFGQNQSQGAVSAAADDQTVDILLARLGKPLFLIDLRFAPEDGPVRRWLDATQRLRAQGGFATLVPARAYDALVFTQTITRTRPTPGGRSRMEALGR